MKDKVKCPDTMLYTVTMKNLKRSRFGNTRHIDVQNEMNDAASWFHYLYYSFPNRFAESFLGTSSVDGAAATLRSFWNKVPASDPRKIRLRDALLARPDIAS